eukprot:764509-Hanusia_phi.AAC.1
MVVLDDLSHSDENDDKNGKSVADSLALPYLFPFPEQLLLAILNGLLNICNQDEHQFNMSINFAMMPLRFAQHMYGDLTLRWFLPLQAICEQPYKTGGEVESGFLEEFNPPHVHNSLQGEDTMVVKEIVKVEKTTTMIDDLEDIMKLSDMKVTDPRITPFDMLTFLLLLEYLILSSPPLLLSSSPPLLLSSSPPLLLSSSPPLLLSSSPPLLPSCLVGPGHRQSPRLSASTPRALATDLHARKGEKRFVGEERGKARELHMREGREMRSGRERGGEGTRWVRKGGKSGEKGSEERGGEGREERGVGGETSFG